MLGFEDTFELKLDISESAFLDNLMPFVDVEYNPVSTPFLSPGKLYVGHVKFNRFQLSIPKNIKTITGTFKTSNQLLTIKGQLTQSSSAFFLNVLVTFCFLGLFVCSLLFNASDNGTLVISAILSILGVSNHWLAIIRLRKMKEEFIQLIHKSNLVPTTRNEQLTTI